MASLTPDPILLARFAAGLNALFHGQARLGLAVSGGPDSLGLLLLAAASRPERIAAATVDHGLRAEASGEAAMVGSLCRRLGVPHRTIALEWKELPTSAVQERARTARYAALAAWAKDAGLDALVTAHHLDDQAETLVMRLARGAGVRGLAAMRPVAVVPGSDLPLLRPLLSWRKAELEAICSAAGIVPVADPSNRDERHERVRVREALARAEWLDPQALARSAANLAAADEALEWAAQDQWVKRAEGSDSAVRLQPSGLPAELLRRLVARAVRTFANEGESGDLRGRELDRLIATLEAGSTATLRGVRCSGGDLWTFAPAPPRRA